MDLYFSLEFPCTATDPATLLKSSLQRSVDFFLLPQVQLRFTCGSVCIGEQLIGITLQYSVRELRENLFRWLKRHVVFRCWRANSTTSCLKYRNFRLNNSLDVQEIKIRYFLIFTDF